jgi:prepilin-type N-terminal cleavage/methylation domain-containing protein
MKTSATERLVAGSAQRGYSLAELIIVIAVMSFVFAVASAATHDFVQRGSAETEKVDSVQSARDFMDQVSRDIHDAGYPPLTVAANGNTTCVGNASLACGITYYSPLKVQYEGDMDGTGTVYQVTLQVVPNASGNCPCILQRGVVTKTQALAGVTPTYYTEVNGLLNSGQWNGAGLYTVSLPGSGSYASYANADVFDGYFNDATQVTTSCVTASACVNSATPIRELQVTANVAPNFADLQTKLYPVFSITTKARLSNVSP